MSDLFLALLKAHGLPEPETEVVFAPPRRWRADYLWRRAKVIVEREGGLFAKGAARFAHALPTNIRRDMEKSNAAQLLGYRYFRYMPEQLKNGQAVEELKGVLL